MTGEEAILVLLHVCGDGWRSLGEAQLEEKKEKKKSGSITYKLSSSQTCK